LSEEVVLRIDQRGIPLARLVEELAELHEARDNPELTPEERQAIDGQIKLYVEANLRKVDDIRQWWRYCEDQLESAKRDSHDADARKRSWDARLEFMKGVCADVMSNLVDSRGRRIKRLDGVHGFIRLQVNGGSVSLDIYSPALLPESMVLYRGWMSPEVMAALPPEITARQDFQFDRESRDGLIKATLETKCAKCSGSGVYERKEGRHDADMVNLPCPHCAGTGHELVPGARLAPRGQHVRIR
jgi:hypothetical protein